MTRDGHGGQEGKKHSLVKNGTVEIIQKKCYDNPTEEYANDKTKIYVEN